MISLPNPRSVRTVSTFAYALLASLTFAASHQAAAAPAASPMMTAGFDHSCGVTSAGEGLCWGKNDNGKTNVPAGKTWTSITAGPVTTCGVTTSGEGLCWGSTDSGKTNIPTGKTWASMTAGAYQACGVTTSGEGLCWGDNRAGQANVPAGRTWASITAAPYHSCGVTISGEGLCWGSNGNDRTNVPAGKTWASITVGTFKSCGVTTTGEGLCWGYNASVPEGKTWALITPGETHSCGVTTSGEGLCWGYNSYGQTSIPAGRTWASIAAGASHNCGVTTSGEGLCWGWDGHLDGYDYGYGYGYYPGRAADGRLDVPVGKFDAVVAPADTTAPDPPVLSGTPSSPTKLTTASIPFNGEADATFTCSLDDSVFADCGDYGGSPATLSGLSDGQHTFRVRATDLAGNTSAAATTAWTVDTTPPARPRFSGVPADNTTLTTASIGIAGEANATFLCSVDGAAYSFCSSPLALTGLSIGDHVVLVTQTDEAGNTSPEAAASWTVVTTVLPGSASAPRLLAKVGLRVNLKTKVTTLTLKAMADRSRGTNSIKWIEYYGHPKRPAANAAQNRAKIRKYATTVSLPSREVAFWVRVKDTKGKWSGWYRTRFEPNAIGW